MAEIGGTFWTSEPHLLSVGFSSRLKLDYLETSVLYLTKSVLITVEAFIDGAS